MSDTMYSLGITAILRNLLLDWWKTAHQKQGFHQLCTPPMIATSLLKKVGFFEDPKNQDLKLPTLSIDGVEYVSCPLCVSYMD